MRTLSIEVPAALTALSGFTGAVSVMPGVVALSATAFTSYEQAAKEMETLSEQLRSSIDILRQTPMIIVCDDSHFLKENLNNFLWVVFTRSNPSHDVYGIDSFTQFKHWGCRGPMVIDARIKPHHAPPLKNDTVVEKAIERVFNKGGSLYGVL